MSDVPSVATGIVCEAISADCLDDFAAHLIQRLLVGPPAHDGPLLSRRELETLLQPLAERDLNPIFALFRQVHGSLAEHGDRVGQSYLSLVLASFTLLAGAYEVSCDLMMEGIKVPVNGPADAWWTANASALGLCIWTARTPPETLSPFNEEDGATSASEIIKNVGTYTGFAHRALDEPVLERHKAVFQVFAPASDAIYRAIETRAVRFGPLKRFRDQWLQEQADDEVRSFFQANSQTRAGVQAEIVDSLTSGWWSFRAALRELEQRWDRAYAES